MSLTHISFDMDASLNKRITHLVASMLIALSRPTAIPDASVGNAC